MLDNIEREIISRILTRALAKGYTVSVFDGEEWPIIRSSVLEEIIEKIGHTDKTKLRFQYPGKLVDLIWLIHGNYEDVVSGYTDNAEIYELDLRELFKLKKEPV